MTPAYVINRYDFIGNPSCWYFSIRNDHQPTLIRINVVIAWKPSFTMAHMETGQCINVFDDFRRTKITLCLIPHPMQIIFGSHMGDNAETTRP